MTAIGHVLFYLSNLSSQFSANVFHEMHLSEAKKAFALNPQDRGMIAICYLQEVTQYARSSQIIKPHFKWLTIDDTQTRTN